MKKQIWIYSLSLGALVFLLKYLEYSFLIKSHSAEVFTGLIALVFTCLGIWIGFRLIQPKKEIIKEFVPVAVSSASEFVLNEDILNRLSISKRELDVLQLMAAGLSNQEIADKLFVSLNTVKTHSSRLFEKLEVSRRTQAVVKARELGLVQ